MSFTDSNKARGRAATAAKTEEKKREYPPTCGPAGACEPLSIVTTYDSSNAKGLTKAMIHDSHPGAKGRAFYFKYYMRGRMERLNGLNGGEIKGRNPGVLLNYCPFCGGKPNDHNRPNKAKKKAKPDAKA